MNPREKGFLLLSSHLGNPRRKPLTQAQLRLLTQRMRSADGKTGDRPMEAGDLVALGYGADMARHIVDLLGEEELLEYYCGHGKKRDCIPVTRVSGAYPDFLRQRLGPEAPGCLWAKGDLGILERPGIALVGSRDLREENRRFAQAVGRQAARLGMPLISGNARGADRTAQEACLDSGGSVVSIVADELSGHSLQERVLYLSEDAYDAPFTAQRALSRNRCIHALGSIVFVAQSDLGRGGTWDGTVKNLRFGWSTVACFRDGSEAAQELEQLGACLIGMEDLSDFGNALQCQMRLF